MLKSKAGKRNRNAARDGVLLDGFRLKDFLFPRRRSYRLLLMSLSVAALLPPIFFHIKLRRFHQTQMRKCSWLSSPPLVCAHGGDSTGAFANTMTAYDLAIRAQVDCIEIDVSRSFDGGLVALHDRDLQRISGNKSLKVGHLKTRELKSLVIHQVQPDLPLEKIPMIEDVLKFLSNSVHRVILDVKIGPPSYEKRLAEDVISVVEKVQCLNCLVWSKNERVVREIVGLSPGLMVGYIVMRDPSTGIRGNLLRVKCAAVAGVYHPLITQKLVSVLHRRRQKVYAWTVDEENAMHEALMGRVDAIVTSNPTLLQNLMQDKRAHCLREGGFMP